MKLALVDYGDTQCTNEVLEILEGILDEKGFSSDRATYFHASKAAHLSEIKGYDVVVALGSDAMKKLCKVDRTLKEYAGCMTYNPDMNTWVLPTYHPNGIYQEKYAEFDFTYDHVRRAVDVLDGVLPFRTPRAPR